LMILLHVDVLIFKFLECQEGGSESGTPKHRDPRGNRMTTLRDSESENRCSSLARTGHGGVIGQEGDDLRRRTYGFFSGDVSRRRRRRAACYWSGGRAAGRWHRLTEVLCGWKLERKSVGPANSPKARMGPIPHGPDVRRLFIFCSFF
jgi:hypothetical protein